MKTVTLQSVSVARMKLAAFGKITHSVTCIVALLNRGWGYRHCVTVARFAFVGQTSLSVRQCGLSPHPYEESEVRI